jgi:hypothetical protein
MMTTRRGAFLLLALSIAALAVITLTPSPAAAAQGDTIKYISYQDFPNLNEGEVKYTKQSYCLQVDVEGKWAAASREFDGEDGLYTVRIQGFGEEDGESPLRLYINDSLIGEKQIGRWYRDAMLDSAKVRYGYTEEQAKKVYHEMEEQAVYFDSVAMENGDEIKIASKQHSNGLVGNENARGRWTNVMFIKIPETVGALPRHGSVRVPSHTGRAGEGSYPVWTLSGRKMGLVHEHSTDARGKKQQLNALVITREGLIQLQR